MQFPRSNSQDRNFEPKVGQCKAVNENLNVQKPDTILKEGKALKRAVDASQSVIRISGTHTLVPHPR
jgi:hypothetical protein